MFNKVVVANRGAIAARVIRCLRQLGIASVAVYSEADAEAPYLAEADEAHAIGPAPPQESYLNQEALLTVVRETRADGLHPGYGFLAENAGFATAVERAGCKFIGPAAKWLEAMGHKTEARALMQAHGLPMCPGSDVLSGDAAAVLEQARRIGFPILLKPASGGGGIGMLPVADESKLTKALERARSLVERSFGDDQIYMEKLLERPRHVEFQVLGDEHGTVRHLFERDCSVQRRHQKVIEEAPAPGLDRTGLDDIADNIAHILSGIGYDNVGTVEMLYDAGAGFSFLEMNTRLQVEHAVTEAVTGLDLVKLQIEAAAGNHLADILPDNPTLKGHAIEARVYAEDPKRFFPSPGTLEVFRPPSRHGIRVETGFAEGGAVTPFYDPMIAKVIAHGDNRDAAIGLLDEALEAFEIEGVKNNIPFIRRMLENQDFAAGNVHTGLTDEVVSKKT
jgi:acetyl-CoA carboxylase biotin carboxylase subunit